VWWLSCVEAIVALRRFNLAAALSWVQCSASQVVPQMVGMEERKGDCGDENGSRWYGVLQNLQRIRKYAPPQQSKRQSTTKD